MEINYTIERKEFTKFIKGNIKFTEMYQRPIIKCVFLLVIGFVLVPTILIKGISFKIICASILGILLISRKKYKIKIQKSFERQFIKTRKYLFKEMNVNFLDDKILLSTEEGEKIFFWNSIYEVNIFKGYVIISSRIYDKIFIPQSVFIYKDQFNIFKEMISEKTGLAIKNEFPKDFNFYYKN